MQVNYPAIAIVGPTASGKTAMGMALARRFHGEIVTCDALQVYRHMNIGTAKPSLEEQAEIPHHLLDVRDPGGDFSAGDFLRLGRDAVHRIRDHSRIPFVVGGTGFYLKALTHGLFEGPGRSEALRTRMRRIIARRGSPTIHRALARVDPDTAAKLAPGDAERNIRAYEIFLISGRTMHWWQSQPRDEFKGFRWLKLGIAWPRQQLYERINRRVEEMFRHGFVAEVQSLISRYPKECHAFKAIGYRQIARHLDGEWTLAQAIEDTQRESRRYAKRQTTWFRSDPEIVWLDAMEAVEGCFSRASEIVGHFLAKG